MDSPTILTSRAAAGRAWHRSLAPFSSRTRPLAPSQVYLAWGLWLGGLAITLATRWSFDPRSVYAIYLNAAHNWLTTQPMYFPGGFEFLYFPQAAVFCVPFALLPATLGGVLWRLLNVAVFAWGTYRLAQTATPKRENRLFLIASVVSLALSISCIGHGQMTLVMGGLMMLGVAALAEQRWLRSALYLTLAVAFKPHALVLVLLVGALYSPMRWRLIACGVALALVPFAFQQWDYVAGQYVLCWQTMTGATELGFSADHFAHLYTLLETAGITLGPGAQLVVSALAALATLAASWYVVRRLPANQAAVLLFALAACYVLIFNPRSERNTYALLAPAIGVLAAQWYSQGLKRPTVWAAGIVALFVVSHPLGKLIFGGSTSWMKPALAIAFLIVAGTVTVRAMRERLVLLPPGEGGSPEARRMRAA